MTQRHVPRLAAVIALGALALSACADDPPGTKVMVTAGPDSCRVSRHTGDGPLTLWVVNAGEAPMAVSLYDAAGRLVAEVTDVGPAMTHAMSANVYEGEFELRCQPEDGEMTRETITVG